MGKPSLPPQINYSSWPLVLPPVEFSGVIILFIREESSSERFVSAKSDIWLLLDLINWLHVEYLILHPCF